MLGFDAEFGDGLRTESGLLGANCILSDLDERERVLAVLVGGLSEFQPRGDARDCNLRAGDDGTRGVLDGTKNHGGGGLGVKSGSNGTRNEKEQRT